MMAPSPYNSTEWALRANVIKLRDLLISLGMDKDLAMATLEDLLPDEVIYDMDEENHG